MIQRFDRPGPEVMWDDSLKPRCLFVSSDGLSDAETAGLWDDVALGDSEREVIEALNILAPPRIERLNFIADPLSRGDAERIAQARLSDANERVPLRSLGDGMNRILGLAVALVNVKEGMLLIDEVENGLHYSVQPDVWKLVFRTARDLNVQVFATTHSWDCIAAFQKAADQIDNEGLLIRLSEKEGQIIPTLFDERRLSIATEEEIEVR
jgi:uncharacterized protein YjeT (DUF2065 family)